MKVDFLAMTWVLNHLLWVDVSSIDRASWTAITCDPACPGSFLSYSDKPERLTFLEELSGGLSSGFVDPGYRFRFLHTRYRLGAGHQHGRLGRFDGASCGDGQRDGGHALVVGDIRDDGEIVVTEAIPTTNEFASDGLAGGTAHGLDSVLRFFKLGG
jgi:hypothetical protein